MEPHTAFNNMDYIVFGIILVSGLLALLRGFVREALSLASWGGAYFVAAKFYPLAIPFVHKTIKSQPAATIAAAALVFIVALVILTLASFFIASFIRGQALTAIDRSLGFIFGILRGALFVCLIYLVMQTMIWPSLETTQPGQEPVINTTSHSLQEAEKKETPPQWIINAKTFPALKYGAKILRSCLPEKELEKIGAKYLDEKETAQRYIDDKKLEVLSTPGLGTPLNYNGYRYWLWLQRQNTYRS